MLDNGYMSVESCNDQQVNLANEPVLVSVSGEKIVTDNAHTNTPQMARKRLAEYFDVLIEMHKEYKRNHKESSNEEDQLLQLKPSGTKFHKKPN